MPGERGLTMDGAEHHVERYVRDTFGLDEIGLRRVAATFDWTWTCHVRPPRRPKRRPLLHFLSEAAFRHSPFELKQG